MEEVRAEIEEKEPDSKLSGLEQGQTLKKSFLPTVFPIVLQTFTLT
jgi:hypothetical protein